MEFNGLPLHPLVVHAAVILAPLAVLVALSYVARPGWRWLLRWPMVVTAAAAAGAAGMAVLSGKDLLEKRPFLVEADPLREQVLAHQDRGEILLWIVIGFALVAGLAAWALGGPSGLVSGRGARETRAGLGRVSVVLVAVVGAALLVTAFLTGDSGSRAVWGS